MIVNSKCKCEKDNNYIDAGGIEEVVQKPSLLLHSCCGPCSTAVVERLVDEFEITIYFYNPCITDEEEYRLRKASQKKFIDKFNEANMGKTKIHLKEGPYRPRDFFAVSEGLENEPEGGARCRSCFKQRLEKTAEEAKISGYDYFGTTLTVSPHKNYRLISEIGNNIAMKYRLSFLDRDFKKKDGFKRSIELSGKYDLYRQNYCGCIYSKR